MSPQPLPPSPVATTPSELAEPMRSRWSPTIFDPTHRLTRGEITALLDAARWAPSWGNTQPWRFIVAPRYVPARAVLHSHLTRGNSTWVPRASVVVLGATQIAPDEHGDGPDNPTYALHDLGQAAAHLTLQAVAMGLAAHQFAGFDHAAVAAELGLPDHVRLLTGIAIGVPGDPALGDERERAKHHRERVRRPLGEVAFDGAWGRAWAVDPVGVGEPGEAGAS